jgi:hypothetical protein
MLYNCLLFFLTLILMFPGVTFQIISLSSTAYHRLGFLYSKRIFTYHPSVLAAVFT